MKKNKHFSPFEYSEEISNKIGEYLYTKTCDIKNNDDYLYAYRFFVFSIISSLMWMLSGFAISLLLNCGLQYIIFCIAFSITRSCSGGMHLSQHNHCFYSTVFLTALFSWIATNISAINVPLLALGFSSIIWKSAIVPKSVETSADYTEEENMMFRKRFCRNTAIFFAINIILLYIGHRCNIDIMLQFGNCISVSMLLCALMLDKSFERLLKIVWRE